MELYLAARKGSLEQITKLVEEQQVDLNERVGKEQTSALHGAAQDGYLEVVNYLLEKGAFVNIKNTIGLSALHLACRNGHLEVASLLLKKGSDKDAKDQDGWTPLHSAAETGHVHILLLLIEQGAQLNAKNSDGATPLHTSVLNSQAEAVTELVRAGADLSLHMDKEGSPLHIACLRGHIPTVQALLQAGSDHESLTEDGWTALHIACYYGNVEILFLLLAHGSDPTSTGSDGQRPGDSFADFVTHETRERVKGALFQFMNPGMSGYWRKQCIEERSKEVKARNLAHVLQITLSRKEVELKRMFDEQQSLKLQIQTATSIAEKLFSDKIESLTRELQECKNTFQQQLAESLSEPQTEILQLEIKRLTEELAQARAEKGAQEFQNNDKLQREVEKCLRLEAELKEPKTTGAMLQQNVAEVPVHLKVENLQSEMKELTLEISRMKEENKKIESEYSEKLLSAMEKCQVLEAELQSTKESAPLEQLQFLNCEVERLAAALAEHQCENTNLRHQHNAQLQKMLSEHRDTLSQLQQAREHDESANQLLKEELAQQQLSAAMLAEAHQKKLMSLSGEYQHVFDELQQARKSEELLLKRLEEEEALKKKTKNRQASLSATTNTNLEPTTKLKEEVAKLKSDIQTLRANHIQEMIQMSSELVEMKQFAQAQTDQLNKSKQLNVVLIKRLQEAGVGQKSRDLVDESEQADLNDSSESSFMSKGIESEEVAPDPAKKARSREQSVKKCQHSEEVDEIARAYGRVLDSASASPPQRGEAAKIRTSENLKRLEELTVQDVCRLMENLQLGQFQEKIREKSYDGKKLQTAQVDDVAKSIGMKVFLRDVFAEKLQQMREQGVPESLIGSEQAQQECLVM